MITVLGDKFSREDIMWNIPLVQLNQFIHAYLRHEGAICRRRGAIDALDVQFDALCETFQKPSGFDYPVNM